MNYPCAYKLTSGKGVSPYKLISYDNALLNAGISNYNLLKVSSILPEKCQECSCISLREGSPLLVAYGSISSNTIGDTIASAVSVGIPSNEDHVGVIMEYTGHCSAAEAEKIVREMAAEAMKNHAIPCKQIKSSSIEATVTDNNYVTVISALPMW